MNTLLAGINEVCWQALTFAGSHTEVVVVGLAFGLMCLAVWAVYDL